MMNNQGTTKTQKKKICRFCEDCTVFVDFKDTKRIAKFTTDQGKIIPRRISGNCAKHQRQLVTAIKRARHLALMPFVNEVAR
ncbi:30S ribosomal protein S18 [bacterium]|nr:30S ribosomal protein S18 [bacterium]